MDHLPVAFSLSVSMRGRQDCYKRGLYYCGFVEESYLVETLPII
jgi:hypothetical protein